MEQSYVGKSNKHAMVPHSRYIAASPYGRRIQKWRFEQGADDYIKAFDFTKAVKLLKSAHQVIYWKLSKW